MCPPCFFFFLFFCFLVMNKSRRRGICGVGAWAWELGIHGRHLSRSRNNDDAGGGRETHLNYPTQRRQPHTHHHQLSKSSAHPSPSQLRKRLPNPTSTASQRFDSTDRTFHERGVVCVTVRCQQQTQPRPLCLLDAAAGVCCASRHTDECPTHSKQTHRSFPIPNRPDNDGRPRGLLG